MSSINISIPEHNDLKPRLCVFGVGGAGGNAVNNMIDANLAIEFWVANTDAQALGNSRANNRIQLGTDGLGAGSYREMGRKAAEESWAEVNNALDKCNMLFITAGMGGGTGTGAGPVIAKAAKERGILTVGVVTKPFHFEGKRRMEVAEQGLEEMYTYCDTLIIIPNQNLFRVANERTTFADAFRMADEVLLLGVRGVSDLITMPGLVNLDFADIRTVMSATGGKAMMGTGEAEGEERALRAAEAAISNPLLDSSSMKGARGVIINITGGTDMTLFEVEAAVERVREEVDPDANIIFGSAFNSELENKIKVSVVATGIENSDQNRAYNTISMRTAAQEQHVTTDQAPTPIYATTQVEIPLADEEDITTKEHHKFTSSEEVSDLGENFIPPQAQEPRQEVDSFAAYDAYGEEEYAEGEEDSSAPISNATISAIAAASAALGLSKEQEPAAEPASKSGISIFGRVAASFKGSSRDPASKDTSGQAEDDFFDVPAFMRRRSGSEK